MKIKLWERLLLLFGALVNAVSGVALLLEGLQARNALYIVCAVLLIGFCGYLAMLCRRCFIKRSDFVVQRTESGELRIAVKAIENQVLKCADLHDEIQVNTMNILSTREGVVVDLNVTLDNNISIPLAVASLQKQIKQYLIASSGIEVKEVRVSVESTQEAAPQAPDAEGEAPSMKDAKEKKAPLHQRLFGRADEPAIVPEPPKEEGSLDEEEATEAETEEAAEVEEERGQPVPAENEQEPPQEEFAEEPETPVPSADDEPDAEEEPPACPKPEEIVSPEESSEAIPDFPDQPTDTPEEGAEEPLEIPETLPESDITPESEEEKHG